METFSITPIIPLVEITEDSGVEFVFELPNGGSHSLFIEDDILYIMLTGNTSNPTRVVSGLILKEGEKVPPGFSVVFPLPIYKDTEDQEPDWYAVALDKGVNFAWKKSF